MEIVMNPFKRSLACLLLFGGAVTSALADSSTSSAASDSTSNSVGSVSGSIQKSSDSSSKGNNVAEGDYRIIEVAAAPARPGSARLRLQAMAGAADDEYFLYLPQPTVDEAGLATGGVVTVHKRPYGLEFARPETRQAFFLALSDDWYRELQTRVVEL